MKYTGGVLCNSLFCNIFKNIFEGYRWNILELYFVTAGKLVISRSTEILKNSRLCFFEISATNCPSAHWFPSGAREHSGRQFPSKTPHSGHHQRGADLYSLHRAKFRHSWDQLWLALSYQVLTFTPLSTAKRGDCQNTGAAILFTMLLLSLLSQFSRVRLLVTPWTAAPQAPLSMGFPRQEYWRDFLFTMVGLKTEDEAEGVFSQKMLLVLEGGRCLEQTRYIYIRHR